MINNNNSIKKDGKQVTDNTTTSSESLEEELKDGKQVTDNTTTSSESLEEELMKTKTELKETKKTAETNLNKLKYLMADFDNYRKQIDKQMTSTIESNKANLLSRFLTIRDDYQRALDMIKKNKDLDEVFLNGLEGILKNLDNILQSEGVIPIETIGKVFDSNKHDVISFSYNDNLPENTITNEIRVGYMLNDKVLRPSLVEISKKKKI